MEEESGDGGGGCVCQSKVNVTVFTCHVLSLCADVTDYYESPDCPQTMVSEWEEFFRPALQECLLAIYLRNFGEGELCVSETLVRVSLCVSETLVRGSLCVSETLVRGSCVCQKLW